ncbi:RNA-directed DNA polymerase, eukaryota [Artemisia annua]|uniref:RNA-directed DNA polymerase, eukaryota n=1 Tax=Artemisia annua TaxID=35608 RepID=A0A2U1LTE6_ARTAN|nr:RNA-directed DNA polymerase, eukaryota [Artemisia annua]
MDYRHRRAPIPENIQCRITKIFVTNLPEGCSGTDLATQVRLYGKIFDIYIARKRDKGGNRFGFVSMLDIKDKGDLLKNLRGIRMGDSKLWFNIARYVLEDGEIKTSGDTHIPTNNGNVNNKRGTDHSGTNPGLANTGVRLFRDLIAGKSFNVDSQGNAFASVHGKALVARMVNVDALKHIHVLLHSICQGSGFVQYLGGLDVLLSFEDEETALAFSDVAVNMKDRFSDVIVWKGQTLSFERLAWLKIQGIPLHLLTNDIIDTIGGSFGKIVHKANKSEKDSDLSFEYVGVLLGDGKRVSEEITLNWKNRKFRVWVSEELGDWIPDFVAVNYEQQKEGSCKDDMEEENVSDAESESKASPEDRSEESGNSTDDDADVMAEEVNVRKETDDSVINRIDGDPSMQLKVGNLNDRHVGDDFIPAVEFDFEKSFGNNQSSPSTSKVVKRKKCKKQDMGRSSFLYTSSNESLKVVKKPRSEEDIFGLNKLLGLKDNNSSPNAVLDGTDHVQGIDLNSQPLSQHNEVEDIGEEDSTIAPQPTDIIDVQAQNLEIEATKILGEKLGVTLTGQDVIIRESIIQEGLQSGLQETMSSNVSPGLIASYWVGLGFEYESVNSEGNSGGILSVWDPKFLVKDTVMKDSNFLLVSGLLGDGNSRINIMNVYVPQSNTDKRNLWDKIIRVIQAGRGWWIIFGDFNAVREPDERKNSVFDPGCARDFNDFVEEAGLREFDLKGLKYTYLVNRCGEFKMSRIDRVFVCDNIFNKWSNAYVRALRRELSDHTLLLLSLVDTNFGLKPFRWFDSWLERPGCVEVWSKESRSKEKEEETRLKKEKEDLEVLMEQQELEEADFWVWSECTKCLQEIEFYRSRDFRQKSRVKWASLGDENSSYFHNVVKGRQARNAIPSLEVRGEWISEPAIIKREVLRFFRNHFKEALPVRPNILCTGKIAFGSQRLQTHYPYWDD